ncbi:MAG TPA: cadherin repeat domain-containing protein [Planctomycetaceae bacterium]|nr:cadherin repeat domain-containing protein [Planctomycetaceae bacterium]
MTSRAPQVRRRSQSQAVNAAEIALLEPRELLSAVQPAAINQPPVVQPKAFAINENSATGAFIGTVNATDPEAGSLTFSIDSGNETGAFAINAVTGVLSVASSAALDFETTPQFTLQVRATDNGSPAASSTATVTVSLFDRNEPPTMPSQTKTILENRPKGTQVATFQATDPDPGQIVKYSITAGNRGNTFAINPDTGVVTVNDPTLLNYESATPFQLTIFATDPGSPPLAASAQLTVYLSNVDEGPPVIQPQSFRIGENSLNNAFIGTIKAKDVDTYQSHTYAITAGNINNAFAIDPNTGVLSVKNSAALDFESNDTFQLTVMATETTAPGQSGSGLINVFLRDVNEAPTITGPQLAHLPENSPVGTVVATINSVDPDAGQAVTYAIAAGNESGAFTINPTTGVITVANSAPLDWENQPPFTLTISVKDNGQPALSSTATLTVRLTNANDAPSLYDATVRLAENAVAGTTVLDYTVVAKDQDVGQALSFAITGGNTNGAFAINPTTGLITVANAAALDFETNPKFTLTIAVTDNGAPVKTSTAKLVVNLTNVNESPAIAPQAFAVKTFSAKGTVVGTVTSTDPDAGQLRVYSIVGGNGFFNNVFAINPTTGAITVNNSLATFFAGTYTLDVQVTDTGNPPRSAIGKVTIQINSTGTLPPVPLLSRSIRRI